MTANDFLARLRGTDETDVLNAIEHAYVSLPITTPAEAIKLSNSVLDELTGERIAVEATDRAQIDRASSPR